MRRGAISLRIGMHLDPQQVVKRLLKKSFDEICIKNDHYSLRAFAKKLGVASSAISEIFKDKRNVSFEKAKEFGRILGWTSDDMEILERCFYTNNQYDRLKDFTRNRKTAEMLTTVDTSEFIYDWLYYGILCLLKLREAPKSVSEIASRLGEPLERVQSALDRMKEKGILSENSTGKWEVPKVTYLSNPNCSLELLEARVVQGLDGMKFALDKSLPGRSGVVSLIATSVKRAKQSEPIVEDFMRRLSLFLSESEEKTDVFELNINVFPRTIPCEPPATEKCKIDEINFLDLPCGSTK